MSKSKYNGVDPSQCIAKHGADCTRAHILFSAPVSEVLEWNEEAIVGVERWLGRVWRVVTAALEKKEIMNKADTKPSIVDIQNVSKMSHEEKVVWRKVQQTVDEVTEALSESYALNTMISNLIKLTNALGEIDEKSTAIRADFQLVCAETLVKMIAPVAPAVAEECWQAVLEAKGLDRAWASVFDAAWPEVEDRSIFDVDDIKCAIQVDGKTRFVLDIPEALLGNKDALIKFLTETPDGKKWLQARIERNTAANVIIAPGGRVVNFVFKKKNEKATARR
jgi:leucyl-tRNA synthetase